MRFDTEKKEKWLYWPKTNCSQPYYLQFSAFIIEWMRQDSYGAKDKKGEEKD